MELGARSSVGEASAIGILARLRLETRAEHDAIEQSLGLFDASLTGSRYVRVIQRFYGFWQPLEDELRHVVGLREIGLDLSVREKTPLLLGDLRALSVNEPTRLPLCLALPDVTRLPTALGCLYVTEGATLGGQVIARHIRALLGIGVDNGGRFFNGYGSDTGSMWKSFGSRLGALTLTTDDQALVVHTANATFRALREWLEQPDMPATARTFL